MRKEISPSREEHTLLLYSGSKIIRVVLLLLIATPWAGSKIRIYGHSLEVYTNQNLLAPFISVTLRNGDEEEGIHHGEPFSSEK